MTNTTVTKKVIETIKLNSRVKAKFIWKCDAVFRDHTNSFVAPPMLKHLMRHGRIRLFPFDTDVVAVQIFDDPNSYQLAITKKIISDEIARMTRLDELEAPHYQ